MRNEPIDRPANDAETIETHGDAIKGETLSKLRVILRDQLPDTPVLRKIARTEPTARRLGKFFPDGMFEVVPEPSTPTKKRRPRGEQFKRKIPHAVLRRLYETIECEICGAVDPRRNLAIDHCHQSGLMRGMLCLKCNAGIGQFKDDPDLLRKAAAYLDKHQKDLDELHSGALALSDSSLSSADPASLSGLD